VTSWIELCRAQLVCNRDTHTLTRACLVFGLILAGRSSEAMSATHGLVDAVDATGNPYAVSNALLADGFAFRDTDPARALGTLRRALLIARDSGNRWMESHVADILSSLEAEKGDPLAALDYFILAIRNFHDSGNTTLIRSPLAAFASYLDRLGRYEPAAIIAGFAINPSVRSSPRSTPRSPTYVKSSVRRPTNRSPTRAKP
jgi:hypothetical protein